MEHYSKSSLDPIWRAEVRQVAARNPRLAKQLWQNRRVYSARFATYYRQLADLPRKYRRKFLRRLGATLAGAALLLALGQALPAHAASITVDGVVCTLAEAIDSANNDNAGGNGCADGSGADTLDLQTDVLLTATLPPITSEITLEGNAHTLDGGGSHQVLNVQVTGNLTLHNAIITGGYSDFTGGGIFNQGTLTLNDSTLSDNHGYYGGGGINNTGSLTVTNCTLSGNSAIHGSGGAIENSGTLTVTNSTLSGNSAGAGGAISIQSGTATVNNSTISGNSAGAGGAISIQSGAATVNNSTISGNSAGAGGGIYNFYNGSLSVTNSTLSDNSAGAGGGIFNTGTLTVNYGTISGNSATSFGGGIESGYGGTVTVDNSIISGNSSGNLGGGIEIISGVGIVNNSTISGNSANGQGGGIRNSYGTLTLNNSTLTGNTANGQGGGVSNFGPLYLNNSIRRGNSGSIEVGIVQNNFVGYSYTVYLNRSLISGNQAASSAEVYNHGTITANNSNVVGYDGDARSDGFIPGPNDFIPPGPLDTVLDTALADNGGSTLTHALVSGSLAIDAAPSDACLAPPVNGIDQRGYARNVDGNGAPSPNECDSGAFEFVPVGNPTPTSTPPVTPRPTRPAHPTATATAHVSPTPTRTPRAPTPPPYPAAPTSTPNLPFIGEEGGVAALSSDPASSMLNRFITLAIQTIGDLF